MSSKKAHNPPAEEELHTLVVDQGYDVGDATNVRPPIKKVTPCLLERLLFQLDEAVNVKALLRLWGPRLEFVVRVMLVSTFLDDSLRVVMHFPGQVDQVGAQGILKVNVLAALVLGIGLLVQVLGSICLITLTQPDLATKALIGWTVVQPILYAQLSNGKFVSESLSLVGGLILLQQQVKFQSGSNDWYGAYTQLLGRMLLPAAYLYDAGMFLVSALTLDETNSFAMYFADLSLFVINTAAFAGLVIASIFVAFGLKSRTIALVLSFLNLGFVFLQHPFFLYFPSYDNQNEEWKFSEHMSIPQVSLPNGVTMSDLDGWQILDLQRYYFFLGLSTSGALWLLVQFGPGDLAVQKDETLLPYVSRAQD